MADRPAFDFITDQEFRQDLEADYAELEVCAASEAWKAVHVLAGSIIEAVLVDYLVNVKAQVDPDPLQMGFDQLIAACKKAGVLGQTPADLSKALRNYRNLIHPGRKIRLNESVDKDGAVVAQALVRMILKEVAAKQQKEYGLTAEQIVTKFESDPSALGISSHLLKGAPDQELERLLLNVLPGRYFDRLEAAQEHDALTSPFDSLTELETLFREAFGIASAALKKKVMRKHVDVLKEESGLRVSVYEERFFRATDLEYVDGSDAPMVRDHLLSRLNDAPSPQLLKVAQYLGQHIDEETVFNFVDTFIRIGVVGTERQSVVAFSARKYLEDESRHTAPEIDPAIIERLWAWEKTMERRKLPEAQEQIQQIKSAYEAFQELDIAEDGAVQAQDDGGD
jgi:hypothetical protein